MCHTCQKRGHYYSQCSSELVTNTEIPSLEIDDDEGDVEFLNTATSKDQSKSWNYKL